MGAFNIVFWDLFQTYGDRRAEIMSPMTLFYIAMLVFSLMIVGLYLSVREFLFVSKEPSQTKGPVPAEE
ncbi:MAG: hypothetical protein ACI8XU_001274 [Kiritimatiellia bacterium]|jgi:hypothetical protein